MNIQEPVTLPPPTIPPSSVIPTKWEEEQRAFLRMLPALLDSHRSHYVAVHQGGVVASGVEKLAVLLRAYDQCGYVPIYVGLVEERPLPPERLPHYRVIGG